MVLNHENGYRTVYGNLRAVERESGRVTPTIALTAYALRTLTEQGASWTGFIVRVATV